MNLDGMRELYAEIEANAARDRFEKILGWCESPIERLFIGALFAKGRSCGSGIDGSVWDESHATWSKGRTATGGVSLCSEDHWWLFFQFPVSLAEHAFRCDFALRLRAREAQGLPAAHDQWFAIECDGHEFHERTKEQAARDRSRDREFLNAGWQVIRFTGSEIVRDPRWCVEEMTKIARNTYAARLAS